MSHLGVILEVEAVSRQVTANGVPRRIVDSISFHLEKGHIYSVLGPSGAGKSSLLRLLNRLDEPSEGDIILEGRSFRDISPCELRRQVGYLFQVPYLFPGTIEDNLRFAAPDLTADRIERLLNQVSFDPGRKDEDCESLSIGERQRVALARLLATEPKLVLLDEPTASLDPAHTRKIEETVTCLVNEEHLTVLMVSHNPDQAVRMGGRGYLLVDGRMIEEGDIQQLVKNPSTELGRKYRDRELT